MEYKMKKLIHRCKEGDKEGKEEIIERLKPLIFASIKKYYFGNEEIKDLFQEGVLKILKEMEKFDETKGVPFLGYMKLQLKFFYMEKRKKIRKEISLNNEIDTGEDVLTFIDILIDETANTEEKLLKSENMYFLGEALKGLTKNQKQIIVLYYGKGLNMRQIAKELGVHYQTIVKTKERALEKMKKSLSIY